MYLRLSTASLLGLALLVPPCVRAKCATNYVKVRGKIECAFKVDDKVLVTLIFTKNQPEGFGEETAIDIHNGKFEGNVAFDTYSSSGFLGGDRCHRHPIGVLVRLIEADGVEKDRKALKIANDFDYNRQQGQYAVRTEIILHGWCESNCANAPAAPCANPN
jgi:hypothetical protein